MEFRKIGVLNVSVVGLGCNNFGRRLDANGAATVVNAALDAGINFLDTADVYGGGPSEGIICPAFSKRRSETINRTKFRQKMGRPGRAARPPYLPPTRAVNPPPPVT